MTELVDIGANLTNESFRADLPDVLTRASAAGVGTIVITGTNVQASVDALALAQARSPVALFSTAGVHPHHASTYGLAAEETVRELLGSNRVVAVGECGLDVNRNYSPRADQIAAFAAQLSLAATVGKPLLLHERDARAPAPRARAIARARGEAEADVAARTMETARRFFRLGPQAA